MWGFIREKAYLDGVRNGGGRQLPVTEVLEPPLVPGKDRGLDQEDGGIRLGGSIVIFDGPAIGELEVGCPVRIDLQALIVPFGVHPLAGSALCETPPLYLQRSVLERERRVPQSANRRNVGSRGSLNDELRLAHIRSCCDRLGGGRSRLALGKVLDHVAEGAFLLWGHLAGRMGSYPKFGSG